MDSVAAAVAVGAIAQATLTLAEPSLVLALACLPTTEPVDSAEYWPFDRELGEAQLAAEVPDLGRTRTRALDEQRTTTTRAVEEYLRQAFLAGVGLLIIDGEILPFEALSAVQKFSTRLTCVGVVEAPRSVSEIDQVLPGSEFDFEFGDRPAAFIFSPMGYSFEAIASTFTIDGVVADQSLGKAAQQSAAIRVLFESDFNLKQLRIDDVEIPIKHTDFHPGLHLFSIDHERHSALDEGTAYALFEGLDQTAPALLLDLGGLTRASMDSPNLSHQLSDRYSRGRLTPREQALLATAIDDLAHLGRVRRGTALSFLLPDSVEPSAGIQYRALDALQRKLQTAIDVADIERTTPDSAPSRIQELLNAAWETADRLRTELAPSVPSSSLRVDDRLALRDPDSTGPSVQHIFYGTITKFGRPDLGEIRSFFERQRVALSVLNRYQDYDIELKYRIYTVKRPSRTLAAVFEVEATVANLDTAAAEKLRIGLGELFHTMLLGTYGLSFSLRGPASINDDSRLTHARYRKFIVPMTEGYSGPPARLGFPDWGLVLDYLLTQDDPSVLEVSVKAGGKLASPTQSDTPPPPSFTPPTGEYWDKSILEALVLSQDASNDAVQLKVALAADQPLSDALIRTVAAEVTDRGEYLVIDDAEDIIFSEQVYPIPRAMCVFHPPLGRWFQTALGTPDLELPSPIDSFPVGGVTLGTASTWHAKATRAIPVRVPDRDRLRHLYIVGRTGSGKTNLLRGMVSAELESPSNGLAVIDPHGDLAEHLKNSVPRARRADIRLIDLSDPTHIPVLNPLLLPTRSAEARAVATQGIVTLLRKRTYHQFTGPRFEQLFGLVTDTMFDRGYPVTPSLIDGSLLLGNDRVQKAVRERLKSEELKERWEQHDSVKRSNEYGDLIQWVTSKLDDFARDPILRCVLGGDHNTVDISEVVSNNGILVVSLPESRLGRKTAEFLGSLVLLQLKNAILSRSQQSTQGDFFLYVDEFQKFAFEGFDELLAEGRKFRSGVVIAHQNLEQLRSFSEFTGTQNLNLYSSILGNVGGAIAFGVGALDAAVLAGVFEVEQADFQRIGRFESLARLTIADRLNRSFTMRVPLNRPSLDPRTADGIRADLIAAGGIVARSSVLTYVQARREQLMALSRPSSTTPSPAWARTSTAPTAQSGPSPISQTGGRETPSNSPQPAQSSSFLDDWLARRRTSPAPDVPETVMAHVGDEQQQHSTPTSTASIAAAEGVSEWWSILGPVVRAETVAARWGVSVEELRRRSNDRALLILETSDHVEYIPRSHLTASGLRPGLANILRRFRGIRLTAWSLAGWLASPNIGLADRSPLDWLEMGEDPEVLDGVASTFAEGADKWE